MREREVITINNHCTIHIQTRTHLSSQNEPISLLLSNYRIYTCSVMMYMYNNPITKSVGTKKKVSYRSRDRCNSKKKTFHMVIFDVNNVNIHVMFEEDIVIEDNICCGITSQCIYYNIQN